MCVMRVVIDGVRYVPEPTDKDAQELTDLRQEREDVVKLLRHELSTYGDNDWTDNTQLHDVLDKHLFDYLKSSDE